VSDIVDAHVAYCKTISDLNMDKAELRERIKRLEEAGGEMQKWLLSYDEHYVYALNVINNWNKAKEAKP